MTRNPTHQLPVQVDTVDLATGEVVERRTEAMTILPAPKGPCSLCARAHAEHEPHDAQSLRYQYAFYGEHGRWPTWKDALAHCPEPVRDAWTTQLQALGVDVEGGQIIPKQKA